MNKKDLKLDDDMVSQKSYCVFNPQDDPNLAVSSQNSVISKADRRASMVMDDNDQKKDDVDIVNNENYWDYDTPFGEIDGDKKDKDGKDKDAAKDKDGKDKGDDKEM